MKRTLLLLVSAAIVSMVGLSGCAFGNRHVTLTYPAQRAGQAQPPAVAQPTVRQKVLLIPLLDQRSNKQTVGAVHNGFGMHTADVIANNSVAEWVTAALKTELERAGFEVVRVSDLSGAEGQAAVSGEVIKVYCGAWTKYEAEVSFGVRVVRGKEELLRKSYEGKMDSMMNWSASSKSYGEALTVALSNAAENFAGEVRRDLPAALSGD